MAHIATAPTFWFVLISTVAMVAPALGLIQPDPCAPEPQKNALSLQEEAQKLSGELLKGRSVTVRIYDDWQADPRAWRTATVPLQGFDVRFDSIEAAVEKTPESALLVITADDQKDDVAATVINGFIHVQQYKPKGHISVMPFFLLNPPRPWWVFRDGTGEPIAQATVDVFLLKYQGPKIFISTITTDEMGRHRSLNPQGAMTVLSLVVSHSEYGTAESFFFRSNEGPSAVPLVRDGTEPAKRAIWGVVQDDTGNPIVGASIECQNVRILGEGLIEWRGATPCRLFSDQSGRFRLYMPNEKRPGVRGDLIPPKSKYSVHIAAPRDLGLLPFEGQIENGHESIITLERGEHFHRIAFEDANGPITSPEKLSGLRVVIKRNGKPDLELGSAYWKDGWPLPLGTYHAKRSFGGQNPRYEPIEVTADSPQELVFRPSKGTLYLGQVIHGTTGHAMPGVFVIARQSDIYSRNLSQITTEQWQAMHSLTSNPSLDDPVLAALREVYTFTNIARTDEEGRFRMYLLAGQEPYSFMAFEENFMAADYRTWELKVGPERLVEIPPLKLFPAAKVILEPSAQAEHVPISVRITISENENPAWAEDITGVNKDKAISPVYCASLEVNHIQSLYVPAGVSVRILLDTHDRKWCPLLVDRTINLAQGEALDLGQLEFEHAVKLSACVVNSAGAPIEGAPVKVLVGGEVWDLQHNTDVNGVASFHVPPNSKGELVVEYLLKSPRQYEYLKESTPYQVSGLEDAGKQFTLTLSDKMIELLFK